MVSHLLFDLDGTLVDSLPGIEYSLRDAVRSIVPGVELPPLRRYVGPPVRAIVAAALPDLSPEERDAVVSRFRLIYDDSGWKKTIAYPGVVAGLDRLCGCGLRCFVVTNKPAAPSHMILEHLGLFSRFLEVVSPDSGIPAFQSKHEAIRYLLSSHRFLPEDAMYVGDSQDDADAAQRCSLHFVGVEYGYGAVHLSAHGALFPSVSCFEDLLRHLGIGRGALPNDIPTGSYPVPFLEKQEV